MEEIGLDNNSLFELVFCQLDYLLGEIRTHIDINDYLNLDSFLLRQVGKMLDIWESIHVIHNANKDHNSLLALSRITIDYFAVINLIFIDTKDRDEQLLRFHLYLLDGINSRSESLKTRKTIFNEKYITKEDFDNIEHQCKSAIESDSKANEYLQKQLKTSALYGKVNPKIISKTNWKYKNIKQNTSYYWIDLYKLFDTHEAADIHQNFLSHFIHGLGISDMQYKINKDDNIDYAIGLGITIIDKTKRLMEQYFEKLIESSNINFTNTEMAKLFLLICPETTINKFKEQIGQEPIV